MAIIVDKIKVAYMPSPKVACTSLKMMFYKIENGVDFVPPIRNSVKFHIHGFYPTTPFRTVPTERMKDYYRICVVRDPVKRLLSCYSNRVCFHKELNEGMLSLEAVNSGAKPNPDLEDFVERLEIYRRFSKSIAHHTDLQTNFIGRDKGFYSRVYQISELNELRQDLSEHSDLELELPHAQNGGPKVSIADLSANALEKIRTFYREDYQCYQFE